MNKKKQQKSLSVRLQLRDATQARHAAVHTHPLFSRLLASDIAEAELAAINFAHLRAFTQIEAARDALSLWPDLSLAHRIRALRADLSAPPEILPEAYAYTAAYILGGLYVAYGSAFGARMIVKALRRALPDAAVTYYEMNDPQAWHLLCTRLEHLEGRSVGHAIDGANAVFDALLMTPASRRLHARRAHVDDTLSLPL